MSEFLPAVEIVLANEGGLVDDPNDNGGVSNFGISYRFYKHYYPDATYNDIHALTVERAKDLYLKYFWLVVPFNKIKSQALANSVFDAAVNCGIGNAIKFLQRAFNAARGTYGGLVTDAVLGPKTLESINRALAISLLAAFRSERAGYYREIVAKNPSQVVFLEGWMRRSYST